MSLSGKSFSLTCQLNETRLLLCPSGSLNWEEGDELRRALRDNELRDLVIVDLSEVVTISSSGLAALVDMYTYLQSIRVKFQIYCPVPRIRDVLRTAHLGRLLDIHPPL